MLYRKNILLLLLITALCSHPIAAADSFYTNLLMQGARDFDAGSFDKAAHKLRIACFGFLDEPPLLTEGLVRLSLAQARAGDKTGFLETFDRIAEVESRFGSYAEADVPRQLREAFEGQLRAWVPAPQLNSVPTLQPRPPQTAAALGDGAAPLREEEQSPQAMLEEALAMFRSRPGKARPLVDRLLVAEPQNPEGLCLLGQIGVRSKQCAEALEGLPSCPTLRSDFEEASFYLKCLVDSSLYSEARSFESSLDETLRTRRRISRLTAKLPVQAEVPSETDGQIQTTAEPGEKPIPPGEAGDLTPAPSSDSSNEPESPPKEGPSDEDLVLLERIRNSARTATSLSDLDEPAGMAIELADDYPEWQGAQFLAAEIAYRGSDWPQAVRYFKRGGAPNQDQPLLLFYMAIALFETGSIDEARAALAVALPLIDRTEFVNSYVARILE